MRELSNKNHNYSRELLHFLLLILSIFELSFNLLSLLLRLLLLLVILLLWFGIPDLLLLLFICADDDVDVVGNKYE